MDTYHLYNCKKHANTVCVFNLLLICFITTSYASTDEGRSPKHSMKLCAISGSNQYKNCINIIISIWSKGLYQCAHFRTLCSYAQPVVYWKDLLFVGSCAFEPPVEGCSGNAKQGGCYTLVAACPGHGLGNELLRCIPQARQQR